MTFLGNRKTVNSALFVTSNQNFLVVETRVFGLKFNGDFASRRQYGDSRQDMEQNLLLHQCMVMQCFKELEKSTIIDMSESEDITMAEIENVVKTLEYKNTDEDINKDNLADGVELT